MHVICNERHIRVRSAIGKYVPWIGIAVLAVSWILSLLRPELILVLLICLPIGVALSMIGGFFAGRYAGPLAHHVALDKVLKGLDNHHILVHYALPASHVLVEPGGLTVLVVKTHAGQVTYQENGRWKHRQRLKALKQLAGQEGIGAPGLEAEHQAEKLTARLNERLEGSEAGDIEVPVRAVIVFANPNVDVQASDSPVPAFYGKKVKAWLRGPGKLKPLPSNVYRQVLAALEIERGSSEE